MVVKFYNYTDTMRTYTDTIRMGMTPKEYQFIQHKGGFPLIAEITRCHAFTKEINHASARCQYFNDNFYCKNCLRVFSAMTGKPA